SLGASTVLAHDFQHLCRGTEGGDVALPIGRGGVRPDACCDASAGGPDEPSTAGSKGLAPAALLPLLLAAAVDLSRDQVRGACIDVQVGGDHGEAPARFVGWDRHDLLVHLHLPVPLPLTRLLPRPTNLQHPTERRRLEELFRLDSIVSILIELVHPRTLNVVERVINDVLRRLVKALRDYCKLGSTDFTFAHTAICITGELRLSLHSIATLFAPPST
ncbi:hypothetical protein EV121DRAFT_274686, partial [Schizophyllum commune]